MIYLKYDNFIRTIIIKIMGNGQYLASDVSNIFPDMLV